MYPDADVPIVQMSVYRSLDPEAHLRLGEALRELRRDNILIVGSGLSFHSFKYFFGDTREGDRVSVSFHKYLRDVLVRSQDPDARRRGLQRWQDAPYAREVHPREEHLMPLLVIAGAGLDEPCEEIFNSKVVGIRTSGYLFGQRS
ncbi:hypothetical protein PINS_up005915 [Pythium insidiosum]|nr:hypothetical protein PINS_up005915 [Pythium insidiosum]